MKSYPMWASVRFLALYDKDGNGVEVVGPSGGRILGEVSEHNCKKNSNSKKSKEERRNRRCHTGLSTVFPVKNNPDSTKACIAGTVEIYGDQITTVGTVLASPDSRLAFLDMHIRPLRGPVGPLIKICGVARLPFGGFPSSRSGECTPTRGFQRAEGAKHAFPDRVRGNVIVFVGSDMSAI